MPRLPLSPVVAFIVLLGASSGALAQTSTVRAPSRLSAGTFVAELIDRDSLPQTDRVVDTDGTTYLIVFDRLTMALREGNRFRATVRFRRTLYSSDTRGRDRSVPLQTMTVNGSYALVGRQIRFTPDPSADTRGLRMLAGNVIGSQEISLPFQYRNGTRERSRTLVMRRNDNIF